MQVAALHLVVSPQSNIRHIRELRGRRVRIGPPQTEVPSAADTALVANLILPAFGLEPGSVRLTPLAVIQAAEDVASGRLDAMFINVTPPAPQVVTALTLGARLLPIQGAEVDRLLDEYPFVRRETLPPGLYPGQPASIDTVGVHVVFLCRDDLPEALVYELTKAFFDALPRLSGAQPSLRFMDPEQAPATPIPLHAGAARYYREVELFR
jgi:hypothetical protein